MATILTVSNSEGVVGRCDANCYCASDEVCTCICGGKNHKVGFLKAMANARAGAGQSEEDFERFAKERGLDPDDLQVTSNAS